MTLPDNTSPTSSGTLANAAPLGSPVGAEGAATVDAASPDARRGRVISRRFFRNTTSVAGLVILLALIVFAAFGSLLTSYDYRATDFAALGVAPGGDHILGTNDAGVDLYAALVHGLQRSLVIAFAVAFGTTIIATIVGTVAAYVGGWLERVTLQSIHFLLVVPSLLIVALVANRYGGDWKALIVVLIVFGWPFQARITWSLAQSVSQMDYVRAGKFLGLGAFRISIRHIIPNMSSLIIVSTVLGVVTVVLTETSLSFLGFGVKIPDVTLGSLISDGQSTITSSPWLFWYPAAVLTLLTLSLSLIGDGLRDAFDPQAAAAGKRRWFRRGGAR
ncbi:ABC transporter permease [uncultured Williamsia sp.]|uniref:ABC transporter permease n=1 Tax=uncultured Williamsia sp. TaxID=259311 RepID=UPI00262B8824|nr:ABC transporter permease [uncultured Williamsia sp.]